MSPSPNGRNAPSKRAGREPRSPQVPPDTRDEIVDAIGYWSGRTELPAKQFWSWLKLGASKCHPWTQRYGMACEPHGKIPRDVWLEDWEKAAIVDDHDRHPLEGDRRLCFFDDYRPRPSSSLIGRRPRLLAR